MSSSPTGSAAPPDSGSKDRKRITDRRAQRNRRERIKAHIAHLEKQVEELTAASGQGESTLLQKLEEQRLEISRLNDVIQAVHRLTGQDADTSSTGRSSQQVHPRREQYARSSSPETQPETRPPDIHSNNQVSQQISRTNMLSTNTPSLYPELICGMGFQNYFAAVNTSLAGILRTADAIVSSAEEDDDLAIRAILHGWETVGQDLTGLDLGWELLKALDQGLFWRTGPVERLAILRLMRSMIAWNAISPKRSERQVPSYMRPTTTQSLIPHEPLIDFFVWPNVRDHLILSGISYVPESASAQYASEIRLDWAYQIRDACRYHTTKKKYEFSTEFNSAYFDLKTWQVRTDPTLSMLLGDGACSIMDASSFLGS